MKTEIPLLGVLSLMLSSAPVLAKDDRHKALRSADMIPFARLLEVAQERVGQQKLLDAALSRVGGRAVMEILFLERNGRVLSVRIDAQTAVIVDDDSPLPKTDGATIVDRPDRPDRNANANDRPNRTGPDRENNRDADRNGGGSRGGDGGGSRGGGGGGRR